jgi:hypothetical protein
MPTNADRTVPGLLGQGRGTVSAEYTVAEQTLVPGACNVVYPNRYGWPVAPGPANIPTFIPWLIPPSSGSCQREPQSGLLALVRALLTAVENKAISEETMKQVLDLLDKG